MRQLIARTGTGTVFVALLVGCASPEPVRPGADDGGGVPVAAGTSAASGLQTSATSASAAYPGLTGDESALPMSVAEPYPAAPPTAAASVPYGDGVAPTTFVDSDGGFQIDVPAGWFVSESGGHSLIMMSYDPTRLPRTQMGFGPGMTKIAADAEDDVSRLDESLDDVVERKLSKPGMYVRSDLSIVRREAWKLIDGMQAIRYNLEDPHAVTAHLVTRIGDRVVSVGGHGELSPFDAVARTLRAAE